MTQTVPPQTEGHLAPNPLELFWENNKRIITFGLFAAVAAIALNYLIQYQARRATAARWSEFATAAGLDTGYAEPGENWSWMEQQATSNPQMLGYYLGSAQADLVQRLPEHIEDGDPAKLEEIADAGDERAPLALWVLANRAFRADDHAAAKALLDRLEKDHPDHFLVQASSYPVQWRPEVPKDDEEEAEASPPSKSEPPELVEAKAGSAVALLRAQIDASAAFRADHAEFFEPKQPTSPQTVSFEIENAGTIKIRLFDQQAPKHVERFLELARADGGWWTGQRVHQIRRAGEGPMLGASTPQELSFGWASTKNEDDRTKWVAGEVDEAHLVEWEDTGLSHFPGTVAVEAAAEGKSQVERIVINANDAAAEADGTRVIIGRVVEGLDVVQSIVQSDFADEASRQSGRGLPAESFVIKSVAVDG